MIYSYFTQKKGPHFSSKFLLRRPLQGKSNLLLEKDTKFSKQAEHFTRHVSVQQETHLNTFRTVYKEYLRVYVIMKSRQARTYTQSDHCKILYNPRVFQVVIFVVGIQANVRLQYSRVRMDPLFISIFLRVRLSIYLSVCQSVYPSV